MNKRKVGNTGLEVTPIAFGAWGIGGFPFWNVDDDVTSTRALKKAFECGITLFDTAPVYGLGHSEELIKKALSEHRDEIVIATKCGISWRSKDISGIYNDAKEKTILKEVDESLKRLGTDWIDVYQLHWPDPATPIEETMKTLASIKGMGKIKAIGVSNYSLKQLKEALKYTRVDSIQPKYNMLHRDIEKDLVPFCIEKDIAILPYSPLASGLLTGKYTEGFKFDDWRGKFKIAEGKEGRANFEKIKKLKKLADSYGVSLTNLAIRWTIEQPGITSALVGCNTPEHVVENIKALEMEFTDKMKEEIEAILE